MKKYATITVSLILFIATLIIISTAGYCEETRNIRYVGGSGEGNYSSIQDAIDESIEGDTIFVYSGVFYGCININKSLNLIGENKESTIIVYNNNLGPLIDVISIVASNVSISGFTIKDGPISGIRIDGFENCDIYQNIIDKNSIGIWIRLSNNSNIYNNTISNNSITGISINKILPAYEGELCSENIVIYHNNFINNTQHAKDECASIWSYYNEGNYWDNYSGLDKNNDGIGDESYISEEGNIIDEYPLMMPYVGNLRIKEFYIDEGQLYLMLIIGLIVASLFVLPIGYFWYRKYYKVKK